jgi:hypothetical protein
VIETIFSNGSWVATAGWLLLLVALFAPRWRSFALAFGGLLIPAAISASYLALFIYAIASESLGTGMDFGTPAGVGAMLSSKLGATIGWFHYLAFDLAIGAWITREGLACGAPRWALIPILAATFIAGPIGFLVWLGVRALYGRAREPLGASAV